MCVTLDLTVDTSKTTISDLNNILSIYVQLCKLGFYFTISFRKKALIISGERKPRFYLPCYSVIYCSFSLPLFLIYIFSLPVLVCRVLLYCLH